MTNRARLQEGQGDRAVLAAKMALVFRPRCYSQRRLGGRCLVSTRPMIAAFSSWLSSRLAGLRFGTIGNIPGRGTGPAA
jgi:hypothetical protein